MELPAYCMRIYNAILLRTGTFPANAMRTFFTAEMKQWLQTLRVTVFDQLLFLQCEIDAVNLT